MFLLSTYSDGLFMLKYMLDLADIPSGRDLSSYYSRDDDRGTLHVIRDSDSIGASYDRYLRSGVLGYSLSLFM
jgi:hypothetical protein